MSQRYILSFWLPLAASWALMTTEGPFIQAAIARLPNPETHLAAFGIVFSLELTIQSPIIMLLAASTALCADQAAYQVLRRFMIWLNLLLTVIAALMAFTPLYDWIVPGAMGIPAHIAAAARPCMGIMILWSAAIGWRRFHQGILIRFGQTRRVSYGTLVRLLSSGGTATALAWWGALPGIWVGSCALMAGVAAEAAFVTWLVRPTLARHLSVDSQMLTAGLRHQASCGQPAAQRKMLTMRQVIDFHTPLAATSLLTLLSQPLVGAGLARALFPEQSLAAWPVAWSVLLFTRSFGLATQEAVIALVDGPDTLRPVCRFTWGVAASTMSLLALLAFTPLADLYLRQIAGVSSELARFVEPGLRMGLLLPGLTALQSWLWALLMKGEATTSIYQAMGLNLAVTAVALTLGVALKAQGVPMAVLALTVAMLVELAFLGRRWRENANHIGLSQGRV